MDMDVNSNGLEPVESFEAAVVELPLSFDSSVFEFVELALKLAKLAMLAKLAAVKALGESALIFGGAKGDECLS